MGNESLEQLFANAILKDGSERLQKIVNEKIKDVENSLLEKINDTEERVNSQIENIDSILKSKPLSVNVGTIELPKEKLVHEKFTTLLKILQSTKRINKHIMLVGDCGSGKSQLCSDVAEVLKLQFYPMSVGLQTTKSDLLGFINAKGDYMTSPIREAFEKGGVLLLDEFDATHSGVVTILNSMLANDICSFPDKIVQKHKDFICIVACNTYGKGGSVEYVGRNRLDSATLDRFIVLNIDYDTKLESKLVNNRKWLKVIKKIRQNIKDNGIKTIVSPRASMQGADLLEGGFAINEVLEMCIFKGANEDIRTKLLQGIDLGVFAISSNVNDVINTKKTKKQKNKTICNIHINSLLNEYTVDNLKCSENIISVSDWTGSYNIYLSTAQNWCPTINNNELFLNSGRGTLTVSNNALEKYAYRLIADLRYNAHSIKLEEQELHIHITTSTEEYNCVVG